jgi:hypothetical protein
LLHFVKNFMADRKFRVILEGETSTVRTIENAVVQGAVLSVTLFLVAVS